MLIKWKNATIFGLTRVFHLNSALSHGVLAQNLLCVPQTLIFTVILWTMLHLQSLCLL